MKDILFNPLRIHLSLVSHTNIGKTTLARTLLTKDVGEVADRAHVTETNDEYLLARSADGAELVLWDTPGFGNSVSLAKRLAGRDNPLGWFLGEVWDRMANKTLWLNQKAVRHVRDTSSVVLYLVNATELPESTDYVQSEMQILTWIGKPVIVLLNQMGQPRPKEEEQKDIDTWSHAMEAYPVVKKVLALDAFARCWVQEFVLFDAIGDALEPELAVPFEELRSVWSRQRRATYAGSVQAIVHYLTRMASDRQIAESRSVKEQIFALSKRFGLMKDAPAEDDPMQAAQTALSARAADAFCSLTDELIRINGLKGKGVRKTLLTRLQTDWSTVTSIEPKQAAVAGAIGSGAVGGLAADLVSGGLTLGLGTLIGSVIGAIGGAGLATVYNRTKAPEGSVISWSQDAQKNFFADAVLLYLAVAHFGRGRGEWSQSECPQFWRDVLSSVLAESGAFTPESLDTTIRCTLTRLYPNANF